MVAYLSPFTQSSLVGRTKHRDLVVNNQTLILIKINANDEVGADTKKYRMGSETKEAQVSRKFPSVARQHGCSTRKLAEREKEPGVNWEPG